MTNLPGEAANAFSVAELYLRRWTVEKAFHELDQALHGEIKTLGYPKAALLSFCVALLAYNVVSVVKTAMAAVHGVEAKRETISGYYLAGEIAAAYHGMMIAVPAKKWKEHFGSLAAAELATLLKAGSEHPPRPIPQECSRSQKADAKTHDLRPKSSCLHRSSSCSTKTLQITYDASLKALVPLDLWVSAATFHE